MLKQSDDKHKWIRYLDQQLTEDEVKNFEKSLAKDSQILNEILELKKDLVIMEETKFEDLPEGLLDLALSKKGKVVEEKGWGELVLTLLDKGLELIENNFSSLAPKKELLAYRDSRHDIEKLIFSRELFSLSLWSYTENQFDLELFFAESVKELSNVELYTLRKNEMRLLVSTLPKDNRIYFQGLFPGYYILKIQNRDLLLKVQK